MTPAFSRLIAIRHGETAWNAQSRLQGHIDIALNEVGRAQALALTGALEGEPIDAVYASDLQRALETAEPLARAVGVPVRALPALRERAFGHFEGLTYAEIESRWPEQAERWRRRDPDFGPEGGETLAGFYERVVACVARLAECHPEQTVVFVAHGGVLDCLYRAATRIGLQAPRTWQLGNASINRLLHSGEGFSLVGWNDTRHLDPPGQPAAGP